MSEMQENETDDQTQENVDNSVCVLEKMYETDSGEDSATYEKALSKMKELEDVQSVVQSAPSDLDTRKRGKPKHYDDFTSSAESEVDLPVVNLKTKRRKKLTDIETFNNSRKSAMSNRATLKPVPEEPATSRDGDVEPFLDHFNDVPSTHSNTPTSWQSSSSCNCRSNEALLKNVLTTMKFMCTDIKLIKQCLSVNNDGSDINESELGKTFPFTTKEKLEEFNDVVTERASDLISYFQLIGGKDVVDTTRRILAKIVGQNLAESYNWCGKNKKPAFNKLKNIINFIIGVVRKNKLSKDATQQQVETVIKSWLRTAGDRNGGRNRRRAKTDEV
ncbi:hypothetical protein FQR65_LT17421 [Abscondita terminalis]|nr:hypothetical protein FQR65_LT17421 [Abscondita terminalis]